MFCYYIIDFMEVFLFLDASHIETTTISKLAEGEQKMSDYILQLLDHFKKPNPVGFPGAKIPEPYYVPDIKHSIPVGTMYFKNTTLYGVSKFRILHVEAEIGAMEVCIFCLQIINFIVR